jgi:hypothetical protein
MHSYHLNKKGIHAMATQFISAFIVIGLIVFLGAAMTVGVMNAKVKQSKAASQTIDPASER